MLQLAPPSDWAADCDSAYFFWTYALPIPFLRSIGAVKKPIHREKPY